MRRRAFSAANTPTDAFPGEKTGEGNGIEVHSHFGNCTGRCQTVYRIALAAIIRLLVAYVVFVDKALI